MKTILTAEEFYNQQKGQYTTPIDKSIVLTLLRRFAALHVKAALEAATNQAEVVMVENCSDHTPYRGACVTCNRTDNPDVPSDQVSKESILNAYPETLIK